jgi:hypothetical protein
VEHEVGGDVGAGSPEGERVDPVDDGGAQRRPFDLL